MAIEIIDLGTVPLDGSDGDVARLAFEKVNANFAEHETEISAIEPRLNTIETDIGQLEIGAGQTQTDLTNLTESFNILSSEVGGYSVDIQNLENSREYNLVAGDNITIDRTNPTSPIISSTGGGSGGDSIWGQITGTLADQTDLQTALNAKVDEVAGKQLSTEDYTSAEKSKLSGIQVGAQVNVGTNISQGTRTDVNVSINSSTGTGGVLDAASPTQAGVMAATDKLKLNGITEGAQPNYTEMPQAIAEGGSDTNLFSVTSLRIRQAILAWWNNSSAKTKLDSIPSFPPADGKIYVWTNGAWVEFSGGGSSIPLLAIQWYDGRRDRLAIERPGWAPRDGQLLERSVWPEAWAAIRDSYAPVTDAAWLAGEKGRYSTGDGSTTFRVPDINGATGGRSRVLRGGSATQGGSLQEDAFQGHKFITPIGGGSDIPGNWSNGLSDDTLSGVTGSNYRSGMRGGLTSLPISDGTNGIPRVADETRMTNVQGAWIVKLAHRASNVGTVDVTALASEQVAQGARITSLEGKQPARVSYSGAASPIPLGAIPVDATKVTIIFSEITYTASTNLMLEMDDGAGNWLGGGTSGTLTRWNASGTAGVSWTTAMNMMNSGTTAGSYAGKIVLEKNMQNEWVATMSFGGKTAVFNLASNGILPGSQVAARNMRIVSSGALTLTATVKVEK